MFKKLNEAIKRSYTKQIDGTGLAVFRIAYSLVLLCEISQMFYFRHLIFDNIPYISPSEIEFGIPIGIWMISVLFLTFGFYTRFNAIINYLMTVILMSTMKHFEYHVFYAYAGINFFLIFMPISKCLSLDRLRTKIKYSTTNVQYNPPKEVGQIFYYLLPFVGIGLVYFDSVFYKMASPMWKSGLGSWHPSSLPMISHINLSWFLNQEYIMKLVGWCTIVFETVFVFLFFFKPFRIPFFILGCILHLGILMQFPIPWFALTVVCVYLLILPVGWWKKLFSVKIPKPTMIFYYDKECPLCLKTKLIVTHFDWMGKIEFKTVQYDSQTEKALEKYSYDELLDNIYSVNSNGKVFVGFDTYLQVMKRIFYLFPLYLILNIPGIYHIGVAVYGYVAKNRNTERCTEDNCGFTPMIIPKKDSEVKVLKNYTVEDLKISGVKYTLIIITLVQFTLLYNSWCAKWAREKVGISGTFVDRTIERGIGIYSNSFKILFGITSHPVFSESIHFKGYKHIVAVVYVDKDGKRTWLPIINQKGMPDKYIYGSNWVNWTFRVNGIHATKETLNAGIQRYSAFWAAKNGVSLMDAHFEIMVKKIDNPNGWERDFLTKQIAKPWVNGGFVDWKNNQFVSSIEDIKKI